MSNKNCKDCYYGDMCQCAETCEYFTPITAESEDAVIEQIIEQGRDEFIAEWNQYISQFYN